ncbi:hypothetical protein [Staphylococcus massiliensis]|uniref:hypothetical protein n=1 Tax=Staphylococcus massiliensis TaxID=555791 RepID=UPI00031EC77F|nr:hypothetical protein [Staphylococcus massiliensis]MCG3398834.1 hypothetical protein [Staphylococcus massiliensis]MCG3401395.1 hypothetical protein [Staphylococcus massiliensis]MCG3411823.1 hypothetical protein [Staphylococcus massiliensis]
MGFWLMLFSFILGIVMITIGIKHRQQNHVYKIVPFVGLLFVTFAITLALPQ